MKLKTQGLSPKLPVQAATTLIVAALAYFGVDLDPEVSAAAGVVLGFVAGYFAPAAPVAKVRATRNAEAGYGVVEAVVAILLVLILVVVLLRLI